ncbi:MAG TPA: N-acetylglucosamine-6-phosphate deacetylase [Terriglobales bacterium]|jgi:N-acetylglucosamine-6-phosphate deacetylase|nr:N-acetylglucosamine-6-phosphate deacetylase [Terriglobales bacterium]
MPSQIIRAARALTPTEEIVDAAVVIEDGVIVAVGRREEIVAPKGAKDHDARIHTLVPGFVDVHIHGAGAHDVMEATPEALQIVAATVARHGTTSLVATTVTAPTDEICHSLEGIARYIQSPANQGSPSTPLAQMTGIHLEGPFLSPQRRGVHPPESLALPTVATLSRFLQAANGCTRILTIAPELKGAMDVIDSARAAGVIVAMGHTDATYEQAHVGIEHGVRHAVHVFNAMRPFSHRETGVLGAVLTDPQVTAEVIADGIHVDDPAIRLLLAAKGAQRVILVSDGNAATGMPDGVYRLGPFEFTVSGGVCRNAEGRLAGSTLTLDRAVKHLVSLGLPLPEAVQMATLNPASRLGIAGKKGVIAPGADADLVLLSDKLEIAGVMTRGVGFF